MLKIFLQNGETAIHVASRFGNLKTLKLLINEKGDTARRSKVMLNRVTFIKAKRNYISSSHNKGDNVVNQSETRENI